MLMVTRFLPETIKPRRRLRGVSATDNDDSDIAMYDLRFPETVSVNIVEYDSLEHLPED